MRLVIDTNLLVLLVVGLTDRRIIARHKALSAYSEPAFNLLQTYVGNYEGLILNPNILTETSNIACKIDPRTKRTILALMADMIFTYPEVSVQSATAARHPSFYRLGLTDAAILSLLDDRTSLVSDDLDLCIAAESAGFKADNFSHLRDALIDGA